MISQNKRYLKSLSILGALPLLLLIAIILLVSKPVGAEPAEVKIDQMTVFELPVEALQAPDISGFNRAPVRHSKMDDVLSEVADRAKTSTQSAYDLVVQTGLRLNQGMVQVNVVSSSSELNQAGQAVEMADGVVTYSSKIEPVLQAWIPVNGLEKVAEDSAVSYIRLPSYAFEQDVDGLDAQTEALAAMNAQNWQNSGFRGYGVKVAIIDGSFAGYTALLGSELPASLTFKNFVDGENDNNIGSSVHGTACAEITADIAPNATFYLLKISTNLDLEQAVNFAISEGVDVISTSLGWYNLTPGDGSGYFANLVNHARNNDIIWVTAAAMIAKVRGRSIL